MKYNKYLSLVRNKQKPHHFFTIDTLRSLMRNNQTDIYRDNVLYKTGYVKNQENLIQESNKLKEENEYFKKLYGISKQKYPNEPEIVFRDLLLKYKSHDYNPPKLTGKVNIFNPCPLIMDNVNIQRYYDYYRRYNLNNSGPIQKDKYVELAEKEKNLLEKKITIFEMKKTNKKKSSFNTVSKFRWREDDFFTSQGSKKKILNLNEGNLSTSRKKAVDKKEITQLQNEIKNTRNTLKIINFNEKRKEISKENPINLRKKSAMNSERAIQLSPNITYNSPIRLEKRLNTASINKTKKLFQEIINSYKNESSNTDNSKNSFNRNFVTSLKHLNKKINKIKLSKKKFNVSKIFLKKDSNNKNTIHYLNKNSLSCRNTKKNNLLIYKELINEDDKSKFLNIIYENDLIDLSPIQFENIFITYCKKFLRCKENTIDEFLKKNENVKDADLFRMLSIFGKDEKIKIFLDSERRHDYKKFDEMDHKAQKLEKLSIKKKNMVLLTD